MEKMKKMALLFPGQGSQYAGMGSGLYEEFSTARQTFEEANDVLGFDLKNICFSGGLVELNKMENLFPALLTFSVAAFRVYMQEIGMMPHFSAGHSLGEYSALVCSGVMEFSDALIIVHKRGILAREVFESKTGAMTVVNGLEKEIVEEECKKASNSYEDQMVVVSAYNSPGQVLISGHQEVVTKVEDELMRMKAQVTPLLMSPPFHCPLMQPAARQLQSELTKYSFNPSQWPVIANVSARPYTAPHGVVENLTRQLIQPVKWKDTMDYLEEQGVEVVIEMGPQAVLTNLLKMNAKNFKGASFGQKDDRQAVLDLFCKTGNIVDGLSMPTVITRCLAAAVCTCNRNWHPDQYQKGVVEPYENMEKLQDQLEQTGSFPTIHQMGQALQMLRCVFETKKVPVDEQIKRFNRIFDDTGTRGLFPDFKIPTV
jgi:[acyl-carrier-protein] S-malonyltransferase